MNEEFLEYNLILANTAVIIINVAGYINFDTSEDIYTYINNLLDEHQSRHIVLDVSKIEYVSSAGLGVFMSLHDRLMDTGGKIVFIGLQESFRRVLELVGAIGYFEYAHSLQEAKNLLVQP